jgi:hypothetical protein
MKRGPKSPSRSHVRMSSSVCQSDSLIDFSSATRPARPSPEKIDRSRASVRAASSTMTCPSFPESLIRSDLISRIVILSISSPGAIVTVTDGVRARPGTVALSSLVIRSNTGPHAMCTFWRKIFIVGYQGLSSRCFGPGGIVTGGTQTDGETDDESTTVTVNDSSNDSSDESETDSQLEGANDSTDTISDTDDDNDSDNETDTDSGSSGDDETIVLGADMDELGGTATASESDTATDSETNIDTATTTTNESSSCSETVGAETTTDKEVDASTETGTTTDTDDDTPTNSAESAESFGVAGLILGGSSTDTVDGTEALGESNDDTVVNTSTDNYTVDENGYYSDGGGSDGSWEEELATSSDGLTNTGSDSGQGTFSEVTLEDLGVSAFVIDGAIESSESGYESGSWETTGAGYGTDNDRFATLDPIDTGPSVDANTGWEYIGSDTSSGAGGDDLATYESTTEDLDPGGEVAEGSNTESTSESAFATTSSTIIDFVTGNDNEFSDDFENGNYGETSWAQNARSDSDTFNETDTSSSTLMSTVAEDLGADGVVSGGSESQTLDELTAYTTTETDDGTYVSTQFQSDPYLAPVFEMVATLARSYTVTDTDIESDNDWACETLGTSATISGGSDCFTVDVLDDSGYNSIGSGPEGGDNGYNNPFGSGTVDDSGSSSNHEHQEFGDVLGPGGAISSGSLSYSETVSGSDGETRTDSLTNDIGGGVYQVITTILDGDTDYETGTENLGGGGTIEDGTASFSHDEGTFTSREIAGDGEFSLDVVATNTYAFGESGTESFTTGGADLPGSASFDWTQEGTLNYAQDTPESIWSDTVSSSWHDDGVDQLTDNDSLTGMTDHFTWNEYQSVSFYPSEGSNTGTFSSNDAGCDTLGADESNSGSPTLIASSASHTFSETGFFDYASLDFNAPFYPDTNVVPDDPGMVGLYISPDNGKAGAAQTDPMGILTALAAAGRNPADSTLPTQGSEASGGDDDDEMVMPDATSGSTSSSTSGATSGAATTSSSSSSSGNSGASGEAANGSRSGATSSPINRAIGTASSPTQPAVTGITGDAEPADDPPPAQGSHLEPAATPPGGLESPTLAAVGGFFGNIWDRATYVPRTVWANTGTSDYSLPGRLYVTAGTTLGSVVGVTQVSDAGAQHAAVDAHPQSTGERVFNGVSGGAQLVTVGAGVGLPIAKALAGEALAEAGAVGVGATARQTVATEGKASARFVADSKAVITDTLAPSSVPAQTNTVFRGLAAGENSAAGLSARAPGAGNSVASHVAGKRASQWISTTTDEAVASGRFGTNGVVEIDISKVSSEVVDVSQGIPGMEGTMLSNWAVKMK